MLKLILLLWHDTFNAARKVALAHRLVSLLQLSPGSKRDFTLFSLQNLLCWQRVHTVGKHHKAITMWPHYWFSYFCTIKYWPGSSHEKQNCFPQAAACVPAVLAAPGPTSLLTDASTVFFLSAMMVNGKGLHIRYAKSCSCVQSLVTNGSKFKWTITVTFLKHRNLQWEQE